MDEQTLIHSAQRGDLEAFNQLVLLYQDFLFRVAMNILRDEDAAADATQQAFISAFRSLQTFRGDSMRSWLSRIVVNACYDELRRVSRAKKISLQDYSQHDEEMDPTTWLTDPSPSPETRAEASQLRSALQACLEALPEHYRLVVQLVDVEGMSYEETAITLNLPTGTIKSRLARARNALRASLQYYSDLLPAAYILDLPVVTGIC